MYMFSSPFERIPKNRSELVNELYLTDDLTISPPVSQDLSNDSLFDAEETESTDSSIALSRGLIGSDTDFENYRMIKKRFVGDPWVLMKAELDAFPQDYLDSLTSYITPSEEASGVSSETMEDPLLQALKYEREQHIVELKLKMLKYFEEECRVFEPDDPGLSNLEKALEELELQEFDSESSL